MASTHHLTAIFYTYALALAGAVYPTSPGWSYARPARQKTMTSPVYLGNVHRATRPYVYHTVDSQVNCTCQRQGIGLCTTDQAQQTNQR